MPKHYVYIIYSPSNVIYYKGYSMDPQKRLIQHNEGKSRYTSDRGPWSIVFIKIFETKREALIFEKKLKRQHRNYLEWLINSEQNESER